MIKEIKQSFKTGLSFGLTSGVITTLGLMIGLDSGTNSKQIVISGILIIAIADALSDALGIHISQESNSNKQQSIWESTLATFLSKFLISLTFIIPILLFDLQLAIYLNLTWGLILLTILSFYIAKNQNEKPINVILEHLTITILVVITTYYIGLWLGN
jgi:VIT1/CCC1 family predicted Fe2+/Mn2+ transporter